MTVSCSVFDCKNRHSKDNPRQFFHFPRNKDNLLILWLNAIKRNNFKPTKASRVCSDYFLETDYLIRPGTYIRRLKPDAVPSVFPNFSVYLQEEIQKEREGRKRPTDSENFQQEKIPKLCESTSKELSVVEYVIGPSVSATTQTEDCTLNSSPTKALLRKKIKTLKQTIRRRNKSVNSLKDLIKQLRDKKLLSEDKEMLLAHHFEGTSFEIFKSQLKNQTRRSTGRRYSKELKKFALTLNYYSPKAYNYIRSILNLPHPSSIRNWTSSVNAEPGFSKEVFVALKNFPQEDKACTLIVDAMAIRKQIIWDPNAMKFVGYCDYGNELELENPETPATEALVFMLCSINNKWKWPIGYVFQSKLDAMAQCELIKTALNLSADAGLRVWGVTCDGTTTNFATMELLGCKIFVESYDEIKCNFKHPSRDYDVYFIPDACHMLKLARNALGTYKYFEVKSSKIEWDFIKKLCALQKNLTLKFANKLSLEHIEWEKNIMKVKLAAQTFSSSVADALEFLMKNKISDFEGCEATITFIRSIDRIFDFLNTRNPFGKGFKKPLFLKDLSSLEKHLVPLIQYLFTLKFELQPLYKSRRKTFILGLGAAVKSIISIALELLTEDTHIKYLLTYKFSQDHIELLFARIRRRYGCNNNPNQIQFKTAMKQLLLKNAIRPSPSANCIAFDDDPTNAILDFKWNRRKSPLHSMLDENEEITDNEEDNECRDLNINMIYESSTELRDYILYYIAGYIVKKILNEIHCESCAAALLNSVTEHNYSHMDYFSKFVNFINRGGLINVSSAVFLLVKEADKMFVLYTNNGKDLNTNDQLVKKIIMHCYKKFSLDNNIF